MYWKSKAQTTSVDSSGVAEYVALYESIKAANGIRNFVNELLNVNITGVPVYCDASVAIAMISTLDTHSCCHIEVKYLYAKEHIEKEEFKMVKISKDDQLSDILTKPCRSNLYFRFVNMLMM